MQNKYSSHFLMNAEDAAEYVQAKLCYFDKSAHLKSSEIGDGNINYVFRVWDEKTGKSLVVKQADVLLRSSQRPLDLHRNKIEAEILRLQSQLAPGLVPNIYFYDEVMCALCMEDISAYKNLRKELMSENTFDNFAKDISKFMVDTLLPSTDLVLDRAEKKKRVQLFTNIELCDITEDLVLTEPYYNYKNRNSSTCENESFVEKNLYKNDALKAQVAVLRNNFMNNAQALMHGDLHSGSIFINQDGIKIIDPEFAFYGPMGYDSGNVIGNLFFAWANKELTSDNKAFNIWVADAIEQIFNLFKKGLEDKFDKTVEFNLYKNDEFKSYYIKNIMADTLGYAGTEIIRRVVGDSKVLEITCVKDDILRAKLERQLINIGIYLIMNRQDIAQGSEIVEKFKQILQEE